ncbi:MAG: hypothetical protein HY876_03940 [Coriobacteriales bacterium]|nr:hypothetical protein [Coriobacteriales bacterium]
MRRTQSVARLLLVVSVVLLAGALAASGGPVPPRCTAPSARRVAVSPQATPTGAYRVGDLHTHTYLTDGSQSHAAVASKAFGRYRLDWLANSEHGGVASHDAAGRVLDPQWPRWRSLMEHSYPAVTSLRATYPTKRLVQGVEWNPPESDHASVGIVSNEPTAIADFEYRFDANDSDDSRPSLTKMNSSHADAIEAVRWLDENFGESSYVVLNHPSRRDRTSIEETRDLNNAAPDVVIGFEGIPGHQKSTVRGKYEYVTGSTRRTFGGADVWLAKVGGPWDALLGEGRRFWVFGNSDFHNTTGDFWPGQYTRTYSFADGEGYGDLVRGMRSGFGFVATGGIINGLSFRASSADTSATMGQTLEVAPGEDVTITARFRIPRAITDGPRPKLDHVDLIAGEVYGRATTGTPEYSATTNPTTHVETRFRGTKPWYGWSSSGSWVQRTYVLRDVDRDMYVRLRGSKRAPGVRNETDGSGNPIADTAAGTNTRDKAWADAWFYSNPIFIEVE